jgi:hypothetical protein
MTTQPAALPDPTRSDVAGIHATRWFVGAVERQQAAVDAVLDLVEQDPPPHLLALTGFVHPEGEEAFTYAQWSDADAPRRFLDADQPRLEQAVPQLDRVDSTEYRLYRSYLTPDEATAAHPPGWIIVVTIAFDEPGRAPGWIDTTLDALREVEPVDGLITNHFHIDVAGTRVINYTEWTDREKHKAAHAGDSGPIGQNGPVGKRIRSLPGVVGVEVSRYQLHRSLAAS